MQKGSLTGAQIKASTLGTVPRAANASNAAALGDTPASGFLHGTGSTQLFHVDASPGGTSPLASVIGIGTVTGTCDNPCQKPTMTYTNTSSTSELVEWDDYEHIYFTTLSPGASALSGALAPTGSSGLDGASVIATQSGSSGSEPYFGTFVQWSSSGANFDGEVFNGF